MTLLSVAKASLFEVQARDLCPGKVPEDSGRTKLPRAQRHGTSLGPCPELELPGGHFDELICISRHFAAQVLSLARRSLSSQVINFLLSDHSLGMPIRSLVS